MWNVSNFVGPTLKMSHKMYCIDSQKMVLLSSRSPPNPQGLPLEAKNETVRDKHRNTLPAAIICRLNHIQTTITSTTILKNVVKAQLLELSSQIYSKPALHLIKEWRQRSQRRLRLHRVDGVRGFSLSDRWSLKNTKHGQCSFFVPDFLQ